MYISDLLYIASIVFELIGALLIGAGGFYALRGAIGYWFDEKPHHTLNHIRLELGKSLLLGLEFFVCGDLIRTIGAPDYYTIGLLFLLVVIRIILTYFINQEILQLTRAGKAGR